MADNNSSKKLQIVAELKRELKEIDAAFIGIAASSKNFANNIAQAVQNMAKTSGGGSGSLSSGNNFGSGTAGYTAGSNPTPSSISNASSATQTAAPAGQGFRSNRNSSQTNAQAAAASAPSGGGKPNYYGGVAQNMVNVSNMVGGVLGAAAAYGTLGAPELSDALQLNLLANRQRFYGGAGTIQQGFAVGKNLSTAGTPTNPLDAALAANAFVGAGIMPSNPGYGNAMQGAATISNLFPGIGLQGGASAMGALNAPGSVNRLRMIGINVRNNEGTGMRSFNEIIDKLWKILSRAKGGTPTKDDIAISAMPGNALDSMLNQYFGGNENLKYSVLFALQQKAMGGTLDKMSLQTTGASSKAIESVAGLNTTLLLVIIIWRNPKDI
jgi:hypothetical protein